MLLRKGYRFRTGNAALVEGHYKIDLCQKIQDLPY